MRKSSVFRKKPLVVLSITLLLSIGLFGGIWLNSFASDPESYTVETNITGEDISSLHPDNLIKGKTPYYIEGHSNIDGDVEKVTDGEAGHIDFWASDSSNFRLVFKLDRMETIGSLLYAGHNGASHATGKYEFYIFDDFNVANEASFWTVDNLVVSYDNADGYYAQKITFSANSRPAGRYIGLRITDVSLADNDNTARIAEIGVYPPVPAANEIKVDAEAGRGGSIYPPGTVIVAKGGTQNFTVQAEEGFDVKSVTVNGEEVQLTDGQYQFTAGEENAEIRAEFINLLGYTVDADIKDSDINQESPLYTENLIKDKTPIFVSHDHDPGQNIARLTDGIGVRVPGDYSHNYHLDFYVDDEDNLRMVFELDSLTSIHELLYAGFNTADNTTGKYEFYVFSEFDPANEPSPWPLDNLVANTIIAAYNVTLISGEYSGNLTLTFTVGEENNGKTLNIYHKNANGQTENYTAECVGGKITIVVEELSPFLIAAPVASSNGGTTSSGSDTFPSDGGNPSDSTPPTGDQNNMATWMMIMFSVVAAVLTFGMYRKNKAC